jgi:hypothetical protein
MIASSLFLILSMVDKQFSYAGVFMPFLMCAYPLSAFFGNLYHTRRPIGLVVRHPFPVREIVGSNPALVVTFLFLFAPTFK